MSGTTLFHTESDYTDFLTRYDKYFGCYFDTYAYCLIPNHYHFLIRVKDGVIEAVNAENTKAARYYLDGEKPLNYFIENQLSRMFSGIALQYNHRMKRIGPLFKQGTKRVELRTENRVIYQLCYIHHNPIHHKLVSAYGRWKYSSYHTYLSQKATKINRENMLEIIGGIDAFHALHEDFKLDLSQNLFNE